MNTRLIHHFNGGPLKFELRRFDQVAQLLKIRGTGDWSGDARPSDEQADRLADLGFNVHHMAFNNPSFDPSWSLRSGMQPLVMAIANIGHQEA